MVKKTKWQKLARKDLFQERYARDKQKECRLTEFLDRTGKHLDAKTFYKYKDEIHSFSEWKILIK